MIMYDDLCYITGVSRIKGTGISSNGKRYRGKKKHWVVYYYDQYGRFHTQNVTFLGALKAMFTHAIARYKNVDDD